MHSAGRMRIGTEDDVAKVVTAVTVAFLIAGLRMFHLVLNSLLIFCGLHAGGSFGYGQWVVWFGWTMLGNLVGGVWLTSLFCLPACSEPQPSPGVARGRP